MVTRAVNFAEDILECSERLENDAPLYSADEERRPPWYNVGCRKRHRRARVGRHAYSAQLRCLVVHLPHGGGTGGATLRTARETRRGRRRQQVAVLSPWVVANLVRLLGDSRVKVWSAWRSSVLRAGISTTALVAAGVRALLRPPGPPLWPPRPVKGVADLLEETRSRLPASAALSRVHRRFVFAVLILLLLQPFLGAAANLRLPVEVVRVRVENRMGSPQMLLISAYGGCPTVRHNQRALSAC